MIQQATLKMEIHLRLGLSKHCLQYVFKQLI